MGPYNAGSMRRVSVDSHDVVLEMRLRALAALSSRAGQARLFEEWR